MSLVLQECSERALSAPLSLRFHQRLPHLNIRKFYEITVCQSPHTDAWVVCRHWGRLGVSRRTQQEFYENKSDALKSAKAHADRRLAHGYLHLPENISLNEIIELLLHINKEKSTHIEFQYLASCIDYIVPSEWRSVFSDELYKIQMLLAPDSHPINQQLDLFLDQSYTHEHNLDTRRIIRKAMLEAASTSPSFTENYNNIILLRNHYNNMDDNIVRVAIGWQHNFLNNTVSAYFWRDPKLQDMMYRLMRDNITFMGQLVQMSEAQILPYLNDDQHLLDHLKSRLARLGTSQSGLSLNMRAPRWSPPDLKAHFER